MLCHRWLFSLMSFILLMCILRRALTDCNQRLFMYLMHKCPSHDQSHFCDWYVFMYTCDLHMHNVVSVISALFYVSAAIHYLSKKAMTPWFFKNNSVKNELILVIFGVQNLEETSHQRIINVSTSPVKCSHEIMWNHCTKQVTLSDFVHASKLKADILNII